MISVDSIFYFSFALILVDIVVTMYLVKVLGWGDKGVPRWHMYFTFIVIIVNIVSGALTRRWFASLIGGYVLIQMARDIFGGRHK